jgi:hypothetical protein
MSIFSLLQVASHAMGIRATVPGILALLAKYGIVAASKVTGLTANDLLGLWMRKRKRRRRRGITGRQLANAARVARTLSRMQQTFRAALPAGYGGGHHRSAPRYAFHRRRRR